MYRFIFAMFIVVLTFGIITGQDLSDEEAVHQYALNNQWHYALNITEESDTAKYISLKTLWNNCNIISENGLEDDIFASGTDRLAQVFIVNTIFEHYQDITFENYHTVALIQVIISFKR